MTTLTAAIKAGYSLYSDYDCPAATNVGGHVFNNDFGNGGMMSLHQALVVSCDTIFYNFGYDIWLHDNRKYNTVTSPTFPIQEEQKIELQWGFGKPTGVDLPGENAGSIPTREWLYYFYQDNAHRGQNWCKNGRANGSYVQQIEYDDCRYGQRLAARPGDHRLDRPGLRVGHAAAAGPCLRGAGQRRHAVQPADRRGAAQPERQGGAEDHAAGRRPPARVARPRWPTSAARWPGW